MERTFFLIALLLYAVSTLHYLVFLVSGKKVLSLVARSAAYIGFLVHSVAVVNLFISFHYITGRNGISVFAWVMVLAYIIVELKYKLEVFGSFIMPLAFLSIVFASVLPPTVTPILHATSSVWKVTHIVCTFLGYGAFAVVFTTSLMYLVQERQLKTKHLGLFYYRLPSLDLLDKVGYNCLLFGFPFLTFGIIVGLVWAGVVRHSFANWHMKEILGTIVWLIYGILLQGRIFAGWRGRKASYMAIIAFIAADLILLLL